MIINRNSQLGLRFKDPEIKRQFLVLMKDYFEKELGLTQESIQNAADHMNKLERGEYTEQELFDLKEKYDVYSIIGRSPEEKQKKVRDKVSDALGYDITLIDDHDSKFYFICDSVYKCAELIKIGENFTGRTLKDIKLGKYTYLLGKHRMVRFCVAIGALRGFYFDDEKNIAFEFGIEMEEGGYFCSSQYQDVFSEIMRILTFVELGDIEVKIVNNNNHIGSKAKSDKLTNKSNHSVFVVDSSWNKIIIRTTGFAVRGHFRLQPCGAGLLDRKLTWIDAFEKHGYKRRPRAEISDN